MARERIAGKYVLREQIGQGAMGVVWRAHDESLGRDVAIKEIRFPPGLPHDQIRELEKRTLREARAAAKLSGRQGIVVVHEVVYEDGRPWIVMELVRGRTLEQIVRTDGPLPPRQVAAIGASVLAGLRAAHEAGVVHRDVKPSNVMLDGERTVITDFGIAALDGGTVLTQAGTVMGTPAFMAPEQARGEYATPATDLWALGATLHYAVEGRPPFEAASVAAVLVAVVSAQPLPSVLAGPLARVISGLLVKDPAGRTPAAMLAEQLALVAAGREVPPTLLLTRPVPPVEPVAPPRRRGSRLGAALLGAGLAAALVLALVWLPDLWRSDADPDNSSTDSSSTAPTVTTTTVATVTVTARATATPTTPATPKAAVHTITYKVAGSASKASLTYSTPSGQEQRDVSVPWQTSFQAKADDFDYPGILASNEGSGNTITCEIYVDGVKVKSSRSNGEFVNVSCSGGM